MLLSYRQVAIGSSALGQGITDFMHEPLLVLLLLWLWCLRRRRWRWTSARLSLRTSSLARCVAVADILSPLELDRHGGFAIAWVAQRIGKVPDRLRWNG